MNSQTTTSGGEDTAIGGEDAVIGGEDAVIGGEDAVIVVNSISNQSDPILVRFMSVLVHQTHHTTS